MGGMPQSHQVCAYCRQHMATAPFLPFCSERCKTADLGVWLTGGYRVSSPLFDPEDAEATQDAPDDDEPAEEIVS